MLKINVKSRVGEEGNFINAVRAALKRVPGVGGNIQIGLGGVFMVENGRI